MDYHYTAHVGKEQYTFQWPRLVQVGEKVTTQGHWLVVEEIVQQAEARRAGIVNPKHAEPAGERFSLSSKAPRLTSATTVIALRPRE